MCNISINDQGAITLARNPEFHSLTKHSDIRYHFISEHVNQGDIGLTYCHTSEMTADIFMNALPQPPFTKHNLTLAHIDQSAPKLQCITDYNIENLEEDPGGERTGEARYC